MNWLKTFFSKLFRPKSHWDALNYGKPSTAGDEEKRIRDA
jgi:hypothetical protein